MKLALRVQVYVFPTTPKQLPHLPLTHNKHLLRTDSKTLVIWHVGQLLKEVDQFFCSPLV